MVKKLLTLAVLSTLPYLACAQSNADTATPNPAAPGTSKQQATPGSGAASATNPMTAPAPSEQSGMPGVPATTGADNATNDPTSESNNAGNDEENNAVTDEQNNAGNDEENNAGDNEENNAGNNEEDNAANGPSPGATGSTPPQAGRPLESMRESVLLRGTVRAIDRDDRLLAMEVPGGRLAIIHVGDEVNNFDQLKVDQPATVRYTEAVALHIGKATAAQQQGAEASSNEAQPSSGKASPGTEQKTVIGKLTEIDPAEGTITVTTSDGRDIRLRAPDEAALSGITQGDSVYVTYREAAAVSVAPGASPSQSGATG